MNASGGTPDLMTRSGLFFSYVAPKPEMVRIGDIAHGLSHLCRFAGHTREFYSVAEHSVYVANLCPPEHRLWGLLHDAAEAYCVDVPRPLKRMVPYYREIEERVMAAICARFGLPAEIPACVKRADDIMLATEGRDLCAPGWEQWGLPVQPLPERMMRPLPPEKARELFLAKFRLLTVPARPVSGSPCAAIDPGGQQHSPGGATAPQGLAEAGLLGRMDEEAMR